MIWQPGQQLQNGKYTIIRVLRANPLSVTYQVETAKGESYAIKAPNDEAIPPADFVRVQEMFRREALKLAKCEHPNIIKVEDLFEENGIQCLLMEYIDAGTLDQRDRKMLSEVEAIKYVRQIGEALTVVHGEGLFHRNVKPANIMRRIRDTGAEAVLIGFELARSFDQDLTRTRSEEITPGYTPLELYSQQAPRGAYTDIYSLGATLYNLLTGEVPPSADRRKNEGLRLSFPPEMSQVLAQAIQKAMELEPKNRPQSVQEWLKELEQTNNSASKRSIPSVPASAPRVSVNWGVIWTAIGSLAAVAALVWAIVSQAPEKPQSTSPSPSQTQSP